MGYMKIKRFPAWIIFSILLLRFCDDIQEWGRIYSIKGGCGKTSTAISLWQLVNSFDSYFHEQQLYLRQCLLSVVG